MGGLSDIFGGGDAPEFRPYSTASGVGSVNIKGDQITSKLDPKYRALVEQLLQGSGGISPSLSPEQLQLGTQATGAGGAFLSQLQETDPLALAESQFAKMEEILAPGREERRQGLEGRLLRKGRLGSTGGARSEEAMETGIEQERRAGLVGAFQEAQGAQRQMADLATGLGAFGGTVEQQQLQRLLESLGAAQATEMLPFQAAGYGADLTGQRSRHELEAAAQAGGGFSDVLGGLITSAGTAFGAPLGAKVASWIK